MAAVQRFTLRQRVTPFATRYTVEGRLVGGVKGSVLAHAEQKRFTLRRRITFFADEAHTEPLFGFAGRRGKPSPGGYEITIPVLSDGSHLDWRVGAAMAVALDVLQGR